MIRTEQWKELLQQGLQQRQADFGRGKRRRRRIRIRNSVVVETESEDGRGGFLQQECSVLPQDVQRQHSQGQGIHF